jgi:predicted amidophosphoribosyltransferase
VALLDDVVTTGATAGQLTRLLHESGVQRVEVWAICRTLKHLK